MVVGNDWFNNDEKSHQPTTKTDAHRAAKIEFVLTDTYYNS
jgi:hypothetical protein